MNIINRALVLTLFGIFLPTLRAAEIKAESDYVEGTTQWFFAEMERIYGDTIEDRDFVDNRTAVVLLKPEPESLDTMRFRVLSNGRTIRNKESGLKIVPEEIKLDKNYKGFIGMDARYLFIMYSPLVQRISEGYTVQAHCILTNPPIHVHSSLNLLGETFSKAGVTSILPPHFTRDLVKKLQKSADQYNFKPDDSLEDKIRQVTEDCPALTSVIQKTVDHMARQICPDEAEAERS